MGMYNEVFKNCPKCNGLGYMQISQIVLGFGGFYLDSPSMLADKLEIDEIKLLFERVEKGYFDCEKCGNHFTLHEKKNTDEKIELINKYLYEND